jgi:hypothetical protein
MHCYFIDGVVHHELKEIFGKLNACNCGAIQFRQYLALFRWPKSYAPGKHVCGIKDYPDGIASEMLSVLPVIRKFLVSFVLKKQGLACDIVNMVNCFLELCQVTDLLVESDTGRITGGQLETAILRHLSAHQATYGEELWKPKCHYSCHLGKQLDKHGMLLSTFVHERKHRVVRRFAMDRKTPQGYERCLVEQVTMQHLYDIQDMGFGAGCCMAEPRIAKKDITFAMRHWLGCLNSDVYTSSTIKVRCRSVAAGDIVIYELPGKSLGVAEVFFHARVDDVCYTCFSPWNVVSFSRQEMELKCRVLNEPSIHLSSVIWEAVVHTSARDGELSNVLVPPRCSPLLPA